MRKLKRFASVLLALVMCFGLTVTAFADDSYTITINNSTEGYTYAAYQVFAGTVTVTGSTKTMTGITWGDGVNSTTLLSALQTASGDSSSLLYGLFPASVDEASEVAEVLAASTFTDEMAEEFAEIVAANLSSDYTESDAFTTGDTTYTISNLEAGYYLVKNTVVPDTGSYTSYILEVVANVTVDPKADVPEGTKTIDDINDSTDTASAESTTASADWDIGDDVPYTLTATLPSNYADYETYKLIFHDTMETGLTFNNDVVVTVYPSANDYASGTSGTVVASGYVVAPYDTGSSLEVSTCTFEVQIEDTNELYDASGNKISVTSDSIIVVEFTAELNSNAVIGNPGNDNRMYLEYSNNPNNSGSGNSDTGETPEVLVTVFTYTMKVTKKDEDGNALAGAEFTLYKYDYDATGDNWVVVGTGAVTGTGTDSNIFTWTGLDDGYYKLVESKTPDGYNTMADLEFYIIAEHTAGDTGLTSLEVYSDAAGTTKLDTMTADYSSDGIITTDIENSSGAIMPSTGGIGTTIFYVVGGVLVVGAVVLLITRKRMQDDQ